jgi:uncharacterized protein (DUF2147 family)
MIFSHRASSTALAALAFVASAQAGELSPVGRWRTFDDSTGHESGLIEIAKVGDVLEGKVVRIIPRAGESADPVCKKCDGPEKNQHVIGMKILKGFKHDGEEWDSGTILDPRSGTVYSSELRLDDGGRKLLVRGYIGISLLGRTQTWLREE